MDDGAMICDSRAALDVHPLDLFQQIKAQGKFLHVSAPMVRYSKLPFRLLVQDYNVHLTYTPMMLAHEFIRNATARNADFTTHADEGPVIAQFASSDPTEFARAALMIAPYVNGVDCNAGCPQSWAIKEGIGCSLMGRPELVRDMVIAAKHALRNTNKTVSIKIRIHKDINETIAFLACVASSGALDYVTVHARTRTQRSSTPPDLIALKTLRAAFPDLYMIANGDVYTVADAEEIVRNTGVDGVMAARGILENPALFAGLKQPDTEVVRRFLDYALRCGLRYELILHHVHEMVARQTTKRQRKGLAQARDALDIVDWVNLESASI